MGLTPLLGQTPELAHSGALLSPLTSLSPPPLSPPCPHLLAVVGHSKRVAVRLQARKKVLTEESASLALRS